MSEEIKLFVFGAIGSLISLALPELKRKHPKLAMGIFIVLMIGVSFLGAKEKGLI